MDPKDYVVVALNIVLAAGLIALVFAGRITWEQFLVGIGLLAMPSGLVIKRKAASS